MRKADADASAFSLFVLDRRSVCHDFGRALHDARSSIAHTHNRIRAKAFSFFLHPVCGDFARVVHHVIVLLQFAANQSFQSCADVPEGIDRLDGASLDHSQHFQFLAVDGIRCDDEHFDSS